MGGPRPVTCSSPDELRSALEADYKARAEEKDPCAFVTKALLVRDPGTRILNKPPASNHGGCTDV